MPYGYAHAQDQLVGYARICSNKREFKTRNKRLSTKLEKEGFKKIILENALVNFYRSHYDEVRKYADHRSRNLESPEWFG